MLRAHTARRSCLLERARGRSPPSKKNFTKRISRKEISRVRWPLCREEFFSDYGTRGVLSEGSVSVYPSHARKVLQQRRGQAARPQLVPLSIGVPAVVKHRRSGREQQEQHGLVGREFAPCKYEACAESEESGTQRNTAESELNTAVTRNTATRQNTAKHS